MTEEIIQKGWQSQSQLSICSDSGGGVGGGGGGQDGHSDSQYASLRSRKPSAIEFINLPTIVPENAEIELSTPSPDRIRLPVLEDFQVDGHYNAFDMAGISRVYLPSLNPDIVYQDFLERQEYLKYMKNTVVRGLFGVDQKKPPHHPPSQLSLSGKILEASKGSRFRYLEKRLQARETYIDIDASAKRKREKAIKENQARPPHILKSPPLAPQQQLPVVVVQVPQKPVLSPASAIKSSIKSEAPEKQQQSQQDSGFNNIRAWSSKSTRTINNTRVVPDGTGVFDIDSECDLGPSAYSGVYGVSLFERQCTPNMPKMKRKGSKPASRQLSRPTTQHSLPSLNGKHFVSQKPSFK
ncbi:UNVERIFIED_CONTAM: hypothetical protein HDU68_003596 [Siphonaria sp. JEL0065]|nr:hypothetical protein HDU68_003596 [Siphonaria sp. JEL0065]